MKGQRSVWLVVASTVVVAMLGNTLSNLAGSAGQSLLYPLRRTVAPDPGGAFRSAAEQLIIPGALFLVLLAVLYHNFRKNAAAAGKIAFKPPRKHPGLLVMLSPFSDRRHSRFHTAQEIEEALKSQRLEDVRNCVMSSNLGPLIAAIEHHMPVLRRCWIVVTGGEKGSAEAFDNLIGLLAAIAPGVRFDRIFVENAYDIRELIYAVQRVFEEAAEDEHVRGKLIADFTGGTAAMSAGMVLATLQEDREVQYLRQDRELVQDGVPLSTEQIFKQEILMSVTTSPDLVPILRAD